jgi:hypothetical protein
LVLDSPTSNHFVSRWRRRKHFLYIINISYLQHHTQNKFHSTWPSWVVLHCAVFNIQMRIKTGRNN